MNQTASCVLYLQRNIFKQNSRALNHWSNILHEQQMEHSGGS
jgi:hypothetical protein